MRAAHTTLSSYLTPPCRTIDPFCPNCKGADFDCLASREQIGLGGWPAYGGTFNDFGMVNEGFCKMQTMVNTNRTSSLGPRLLTDARIFSGVGLSQAQFGTGGLLDDNVGDGSVSCGMCLEVSARMALWDCEREPCGSRTCH